MSRRILGIVGTYIIIVCIVTWFYRIDFDSIPPTLHAQYNIGRPRYASASLLIIIILSCLRLFPPIQRIS